MQDCEERTPQKPRTWFFPCISSFLRIGPSHATALDALPTAAWYRMPFHSVPGMQWCRCHGQRPLTVPQFGVGFAVLEFAQQACTRPQSGSNAFDGLVVLRVRLIQCIRVSAGAFKPVCWHPCFFICIHLRTNYNNHE